MGTVGGGTVSGGTFGGGMARSVGLLVAAGLLLAWGMRGIRHVLPPAAHARLYLAWARLRTTAAHHLGPYLGESALGRWLSHPTHHTPRAARLPTMVPATPGTTPPVTPPKARATPQEVNTLSHLVMDEGDEIVD